MVNEASIVRELHDEMSIRAVLLRYCRGIDRCDAELLRSCYHEDAFDDHGPFKGGRDDLVEYSIAQLRGRTESHGQVTSHLIGNVLIERDGDVARVESYFKASHVEDRADHFRVFEFNGRYVDRFERRNGEWRIGRREVIHDWSEIRNHRRGLVPGRHDYAQGTIFPDDAIYQR